MPPFAPNPERQGSRLDLRSGYEAHRHRVEVSKTLRAAVPMQHSARAPRHCSAAAGIAHLRPRQGARAARRPARTRCSAHRLARRTRHLCRPSGCPLTTHGCCPSAHRTHGRPTSPAPRETAPRTSRCAAQDATSPEAATSTPRARSMRRRAQRQGCRAHRAGHRARSGTTAWCSRTGWARGDDRAPRRQLPAARRPRYPPRLRASLRPPPLRPPPRAGAATAAWWRRQRRTLAWI